MAFVFYWFMEPFLEGMAGRQKHLITILSSHFKFEFLSPARRGYVRYRTIFSKICKVPCWARNANKTVQSPELFLLPGPFLFDASL